VFALATGRFSLSGDVQRRYAFARAAFFCLGLVVFAGDCHFDFSRPGRPPYRGSGTVSPPCFRFRARLVTPVSGSWRAVVCAPVAARFVGVGPRPLAFSARVFGMSSS
jgi:hypothetical protein